jgi:hypothetical protein
MEVRDYSLGGDCICVEGNVQFEIILHQALKLAVSESLNWTSIRTSGTL